MLFLEPMNADAYRCLKLSFLWVDVQQGSEWEEEEEELSQRKLKIVKGSGVRYQKEKACGEFFSKKIPNTV